LPAALGIAPRQFTFGKHLNECTFLSMAVQPAATPPRVMPDAEEVERAQRDPAAKQVQFHPR
jgi:hypothetical protein